MLSAAFLLPAPSGCAATAPQASAIAQPVVAAPPAPPPLPLASELPLAEWLPASSVLAARVDLAALQKTGPLADLLAVWLGDDSAWLEQARRVHVGVEPVAASERVVLVIEADAAPVSNANAAWTQIAQDAWVACVRACDGYALARTAPARSTEVRAALASAPPAGELAVAHAGELLDEGAPAKSALRERLLDTQVGVSSELREGTLRLTRDTSTLTAELHASFTSRGVASSASLLARGAVFEAADELERVGMMREADLLYAISMALGPDDMTAKLSVPLDAVPSLAMAWLAARKPAQARDAIE